MSVSPTPLRVLHLTAGSDAGGVSRYLFDLCRSMRALGHDVAIGGERGAWHNLFDQTDWPWHDLPMKGGPLALWRTAGAVRALLNERPADVVHVHSRRAALVARRACGGRTPILFTLHLTRVPMRGPRRWFSDFGDHAHAPSTEAARWLTDEAGVDSSRVSMIPHGIDVGRFPMADAAHRRDARAALGLTDEATIAAYVGRFDHGKNELWLGDLMRAAADRLPQLRLLLAGQGPGEAALRRRFVEAGVADRVVFLGYVEPLPVYRAADALLLPSAIEGFSLACAEAMSVGRPVLRTRTAGTSEMIVEGVTGRSVPIDRDAFVEGTLAMMANRAALANMGPAAAKHVRAHLTLQRQVEATLGLYARLSRGSR